MDLIHFPSGASTISSVATFAAPWFSELVLLALVLAGIAIAGVLVSNLTGKVSGTVKTAVGVEYPSFPSAGIYKGSRGRHRKHTQGKRMAVQYFGSRHAFRRAKKAGASY
jgi:hypothetical protein